MSEPTLIERLNTAEPSQSGAGRLMRRAAASIAELETLASPEAVHRHYMRGYNAANARNRSYVAELEAERDGFRAQSIDLTADNYAANARIEELEAERDRLKAALANAGAMVTQKSGD